MGRDQLLSILMATHDLNAEDPTLAQFLAAARTDMKRRMDLQQALLERASHRAADEGRERRRLHLDFFAPPELYPTEADQAAWPREAIHQ